MKQSQALEFRYEKANPEEIIYKLKAMIKILGESQNGNE